MLAVAGLCTSYALHIYSQEQERIDKQGSRHALHLKMHDHRFGHIEDQLTALQAWADSITPKAEETETKENDPE